MERFWTKIHKCDHSDVCAECCWLWTAGKNHSGYGYFRLNGHKVRAHIVAYELANGPRLPMKELCVCHTCDNPACVNPAHLRLGTQGDNMREKAMRGRTGRSRLSEVEVVEIRLLLASGDHTQDEIAAWYGVAHGTISDIHQRRTYRHVALESVLG